MSVTRDRDTRTFDSTWFGKEVTGSRVGILGMGRIGTAIAERLRGFGCSFSYHNRSRMEDVEEELGAEYCENVVELAEKSDFLVVSCPATKETEKIIDAEVLEALPKDAIVVNIARGSVVDQDAIYEALQNRSIRCYATDVTEPEPLPRDHKLLTLSTERFLCTPHIGSATLSTRSRMLGMALTNLLEAVAGNEPPNPLNVV